MNVSNSWWYNLLHKKWWKLHIYIRYVGICLMFYFWYNYTYFFNSMKLVRSLCTTVTGTETNMTLGTTDCTNTLQMSWCTIAHYSSLAPRYLHRANTFAGKDFLSLCTHSALSTASIIITPTTSSNIFPIPPVFLQEWKLNALALFLAFKSQECWKMMMLIMMFPESQYHHTHISS